MLKKMILINSAEFDYAEIDLEKDIFFAGDNGTGKTSSIIALFYLFSGDNNSRRLGISSDKKSFKEYYFPDDRNSFIIYVFDSFFIFTYKQNGEIFKRFCKKSFDIEEIIENSRLKSFKEIQNYLKDAPQSYLTKGSEYREIIYGQNRKYQDFKITSIKNYNVFVELFNQTFNVDKAIVDANSIKRAIQKSLNMEEKNIEFNYQKYMDEIKKFQDSYLFFRKFEKEGQKINQAFKLQEQLLSTEKEIETLSSNILYRQSIEESLIEQSEERLKRLEKQQSEYQSQREQKQKSLNRMRERFAKDIATIKKEISDIEKLKQKFTPKSYEEQQNLFAKLPFLEKEQREKQQQLTLLEANILNALNSVDQEITNLSFKRDSELQQQKRVKLEQLKAKQAEQLSEEKERLKGEQEHTEHKIVGIISNSKEAIEEIEEVQEEKRKESSRLQGEYRERLNSFRDEHFKLKRVYQEKIEELEEQERKLKREKKEFKDEAQNQKLNLYKKQKKSAQILLEMRSELNQIIREKKSILHTEEGSFKSFLQQSGISWERELYPFMDASLLSIPTAELSPKIISAEQPLGIELNSKTLKTIPTQEEAEESISKAKLKKQQELQIYKAKREEELELFQKSRKELDKEQKRVEYELDNLNKIIKIEHKKIVKINNDTLPQYEQKLKQESQEKIGSLKREIEKISEEIQSHIDEIKKEHQTIRDFIKEQQHSLRVFQKKQNQEQNEEKQHIERWLRSKEEVINKLIESKQKSREKLSKDDVIQEIEQRLTKVKKEIKLANDANYYLKEYEKAKEFITTLAQKQSRLIMTQQNRDTLENKILNRESEIIRSENSNYKAQEKISNEIEKLKDGLTKSKALKFENIEAKESDIYLHRLIELYRASKLNHKENRVNLKEILSQINSLKNNPFSDIRFKIENFSNFDRLCDDFETIERLHELKEFKEKQFDPLKQATNEEYLNFIKNEIPSKLGSLSHSEDKFQEQVKKINENLSTIDFSVVKEIKIKTEIGNQRSVMTLINEMNSLVGNLTITDREDSLFFDRTTTNQDLQKIANLLKEIKETLKGGAITLLDTIDLSLEFVENGTKKSNITQIKNESSTGGTILLKMALAVSILGLYTQERESTFFLILDEVSRLHSHNQDILRSFANSRGFRIVFVTPEPVYAKPDEIKYYKFRRREDNRFEVISLNI